MGDGGRGRVPVRGSAGDAPPGHRRHRVRPRSGRGGSTPGGRPVADLSVLPAARAPSLMPAGRA